MTWFKNMKISLKLILAFVLVVVIAIIVGAFLLIEMRNIDSSYSAAMRSSEDRISHVFTAQESFTEAAKALRESFMPENTATDLERIKTTITTNTATAISEFQILVSNADGEMLSTAQTVLTQLGNYRDRTLTIIDSLLAVGNLSIDDADYRAALVAAQDEIIAMQGEFVTEMNRNINEISDQALAVFEQQIVQNGANANRAVVIAIVLLVIMAAVALVIAFYVSSLVSTPLKPLASFMNQAAQTGDLNVPPETQKIMRTFSQYNDETGQTIASCEKFVEHVKQVSQNLETIASGDLSIDVEVLSNRDTMGGSLSRMVDNLNNMFGEIQNATGQVSVGSKQIADGAQALAQGSTEQAASVEELSASIGEISRKTKENADMAVRAAKLADTIKDSAEKGSMQMNEMTSAVKEINQASQSISKVIKVIDDIAFQTNILALNAAVEAARAGQHGKGFAVVAEEVRNLAAKSAEAAKDTGGLIANSMEKAELGARIADNTAASLTEIVSGINESNVIVSEIATSSHEQSEGISQINVGIDQVAQVIQQNSATAEESAAASEEMSSQSNMLEEMISQFKLKGSTKTFGIEASPMTQQIPTITTYKTEFDNRKDTGAFGKY